MLPSLLPHGTSLINLSPLLCSFCLLQLSLHSLSSIFPLSLSSYASCGQYLSLLLPHPCQQASLFTLAWPLPFIRMTNKVERKHTQYTHIKTLVYTAQQISILLWMLPALCWCKQRTVVASALLFTVICWGCGRTKRDRNRLNKLVKRATSDLRPIWDEHPSWTTCMRLEAITVRDSCTHRGGTAAVHLF